MKVRLLEEVPMLRDMDNPGEDPIWFKKGEIFEVVEKKVMRHDKREWYKVKSKWFTKPFEAFHNPDIFEIIEDE